MSRELPHETTVQENKVFFTVCRLLNELGYRGEVQKNPIIFQDGEVWRPDIYIPGLGQVIEVDGRAHDRNDQMQKDARRDDFYNIHMGVWVEVVPNWRAHNDFQLELTLRNLLVDRMRNPPSRQRYCWTAKRITIGRKSFLQLYPGEASAKKSGNAARFKTEGFTLYYGFGGFKVFIRPKRSVKLAEPSADEGKEK